jgi:hypothetical protein
MMERILFINPFILFYSGTILASAFGLADFFFIDSLVFITITTGLLVSCGIGVASTEFSEMRA